MSEKWKPIQDFEDYYWISDKGRVMSLERDVNRGNHIMHLERKFLKPHYDIFKNEKRYPMVNLSKKGKGYTRFIHRLVAQHFIDNPHHLPCVNHKDENILNNCADNLEWCSYSYNNSYNHLAVKKGIDKRIPILQFSLDGHLLREWSHAGQVEKELGISARAIYECCKGRSKSSGGFKWTRK